MHRTILVPAISQLAKQSCGFLSLWSQCNVVDSLDVVLVQDRPEHPQVVRRVARHSEPRADDHGAHRRLLQDPSGCHVGEAHAVLRSHLGKNRQQVLEVGPRTPRGNHVKVLCACEQPLERSPFYTPSLSEAKHTFL